MKSIRETLLSAKPAEKTVDLDAFKDARGKPLRVLVRALTVAEQVGVEKEAKGDGLRMGMLLIVHGVRDPKTGEPVFTVEDIAALENQPVSAIQRLVELVGQVNKAPEETAKN
jgi:hypothetical protein